MLGFQHVCFHHVLFTQQYETNTIPKCHFHVIYSPFIQLARFLPWKLQHLPSIEQPPQQGRAGI